MFAKKKVQLGGQPYLWDGKSWSCITDGTEPPTGVVHQLEAMVYNDRLAEDDAITNRNELMERIKVVRAMGQIKRAERMALRLLADEPRGVTEASALCSLLRELRRPAEAVELADRFAERSYAPLLTTRAAALCDLERWEEALLQIRQVLQKKRTKPAELIEQRIRSGAPHLFRRPVKGKGSPRQSSRAGKSA